MPAQNPKGSSGFCYMVCSVSSFHWRHWRGLVIFFLPFAEHKTKRKQNINGVGKVKQKAFSAAESGPKELCKPGSAVPCCIIFRGAGCGYGALYLLQEHQQMGEEKKKKKFLTLCCMKFPEESTHHTDQKCGVKCGAIC